MFDIFRGDETRLPLTKVCSRAGVSIATGHRWRLSGKLETGKLGGRHYCSREQWERFIEKCNGGSNPTRPAGVPGARTAVQRRRDDAKAAARCEAMGV